MDVMVATDDTFPRNRSFTFWGTGDFSDYSNVYSNLQELQQAMKPFPSPRICTVRGSLEGGYIMYHSDDLGEPYENVGMIRLSDRICPPEIRYTNVWMRIDEERHDEVREVLRNEYGLVPSNSCESTRGQKDEKLVWVYSGTEMFWVDFLGNDAPDPDDRETVSFKYWEDRLTPEVVEMDHMLDVSGGIYSSFRPSVVFTKRPSIIDGAP